MQKPKLTVLIVCLMTMLTASCAVSGLRGSFCDPQSGLGPVELTDAEIDALSSEPKRAILKLNQYGKTNCDWK
jgi:hypothetical protein